MEESNAILESLLYQKLVGVNIINESQFVRLNNEVLMDSIVFYFEKNTICLTPLIDSDEIKISVFEDTAFYDIEKAGVFSNYIGQNLKLTWLGINIKGYLDVLIMAFEDLKPDFLILSEGSCLKVFLISPALAFSSYYPS